jgi:hypothetical protein
MSSELLGRDYSGAFTDYSLPPPARCQDVALAANTIRTVTAPATLYGDFYNRAFFSFQPGVNVWVTLDGSDPVVPGAGTSNASTQELLPGVRQLGGNGTTQIKMISDTTAYVNIRFDMGQQTK